MSKNRVFGARFAKDSGVIDGEKIDWDFAKVWVASKFSPNQIKNGGAVGFGCAEYKFSDAESGKAALAFLKDIPLGGLDLDVEVESVGKYFSITSIKPLKG